MLFRGTYYVWCFPNPFNTNDLFWYPLKTSKNLWFSDVFRGYRKRSVTWNVLTYYFLTRLKVSSNFIYYKTAFWKPVRNELNLFAKSMGSKWYVDTFIPRLKNCAKSVQIRSYFWPVYLDTFHAVNGLPTSFEVLQSCMSKIFRPSSVLRIYWDRRRMNLRITTR